MIDTSLFDCAAQFAIQMHSGTERRGKDYPYIMHPFEAVTIVASITSDPEMLAAAVLHDTVEDTEATIEQIREMFGERVATLVQNETAPSDKGLPWRDKKQAQALKIASSDRDSKIVAIGDKLSNLRTIASDYSLLGDELWSRFHAPGGKKDIEWYYRSLAAALFELAETAPYQEFVTLIDSTFGEMDYDEAVAVNLDDYEESGGGYMATSYNHRNGATMVKFYNPHLGKELASTELRMAHAVFRMGIPTPMPGRLVTDGSRFGAEFRRISPKESFARFVSNHPDSCEEIALRFARMCRQLHSTPCNTAVFGSEKEHSLQIVRRCPHLSDSDKEKIATFLQNLDEPQTCLHGDMHIGNVITTALLQSDNGAKNRYRDFWIDMGDFRWGNPMYDLGMFYMVSHNEEKGLTEHLFHIDKPTIRRLWDIFIRAYSPDADEKGIAEIEEQLKKFAALKLIYYGTVDQMRPEMMQTIRAAFEL